MTAESQGVLKNVKKNIIHTLGAIYTLIAPCLYHQNKM